jgi:hypothetical protein
MMLILGIPMNGWHILQFVVIRALFEFDFGIVAAATVTLHDGSN